MENKIELKLKRIKDKGEALGIFEDGGGGVMRSAEIIYEAYDGAVITKILFSDKSLKEIKKKWENQKVYLILKKVEKSEVEK